eukprot:318339_1
MSFINSFLPKDYKISYIAWDFEHCKKHKERLVVDELTKFAEYSLQRTGFFHSNPKSEALTAFARRTHDISPDDPDNESARFEDSDKIKIKEKEYKDFCKPNELKSRIYDLGCFQKGVMRTNCLDSLDRTDVAQSILGKCVLGYQLYAMGICDTPWVDHENDFIRIVLQIYERMGDCLALQYCGSQMRRQTGPREMIISLKRHYQNNFSDNMQQLQDSLNIFLGMFRPDPSVGSYRIWELRSDYYLHNRLTTIHKKMPKPLSKQPNWWISSVLSFNKTFIHCYKYIMLSKQISPPTKPVFLMSNVCQSIEAVISKREKADVDTFILHDHITHSYLPTIKFLESNDDNDKDTESANIGKSNRQEQKFFQLAFDSSRLTLFDEEMKLQCHKVKEISSISYQPKKIKKDDNKNDDDKSTNSNENNNGNTVNDVANVSNLFMHINDWNERGGLAMDKQDFTTFLNENYGRSVNDHALPKLQYHFKPLQINKRIKARFEEIGIVSTELIGVQHTDSL